MYGTLDNISEDLFRLIIQIHKTTFNHEDFLKCMPLPPSHVKVLFCLVHTGSNSVSRLAESLRISKPNMTPIIDNLINEGLITRSYDPNDRRKILIELNDKGKILLENERKRIISSLSAKINNLTPEDRDILSSTTKKLNDIISKF
ncbi:MAG: MarR family transcriptional regulator [Clostridium sp.]